jgi:hypothetical protein
MVAATRLSLVAMLLAGLAPPALACKGQKVIYSDDFAERDAGWFIAAADLESGRVAFGGDRMLVRMEGDRGNSILNMAFGLPTDTDICMRARIVDGSDLNKGSVGMVFWAKGYDDQYLYDVQGNGLYAIYHWTERAWQTITPPAAAPAFKAGLGEDNLLRVTTKGQTATLFLNDQQIARFRAPTPTGTVKAGIRVTSHAPNSIGVEFRDFTVTDVR